MGILDKIKKKPEASGAAAKAEASVEGAKKTQPAVPVTKAAQPAIAGVQGVLIRPVISEKAARDEAMGSYTFVVSPRANKISVKRAVQALYGVAPAAVRIMNTEGKKSYVGRRVGKRTDTKKAIVTLPKGKTISVHEGV